MSTTGWSTQQLAEFVAAVSTAESESAAAVAAVDRVAEALDAVVAAIVCDGELIAAIGYPDGTAPRDELAAVTPGREGSSLDVPGIGACPAAAASLEHPAGARLVIARPVPHGLTREETGLLRGMARVASMTMRTLRVLDNERLAHEKLERLANDQAALRRVATLVARAASRTDIYAAVAAEIAQRLGADVAAVLRYEADETATIVGGWSVAGLEIPVGARLSVAGQGVAVSVLRKRETARVERFHGPPGSVADTFRNLGVHTGVGCPIIVEDRLWGVAFGASARPEALPSGSEARIAEFTELIATAIANAEARAELRRVAEEQAALRRVATLVARGAPADEVFDAVASETRRTLDFDTTFLYRLDPDGAMTVMATDATLPVDAAVGDRWTPLRAGVVDRVLHTDRPARIDSHKDEPGSPGEQLRAFGYGGAVAAPILVEGRLWGVMSAAWALGRSAPAGSEGRLDQFSELIATALSNAEAREQLARVAEEQAALRRVATLVARGEPPSVVFAAVAAEAGRVVPAADVTLVGRYVPDDAVEFVGGWSRDSDPSFVGDRVALGGHNVSTLVFERREPARVDYVPDDTSPATAVARNWSRASAGAPISVEGQLWGVMLVGSLHRDALPAGIEHRLAAFTELIATAIGNAQAREELRRVAEEQAALLRVATLVAETASPSAVFAAVAAEVRGLMLVDRAFVARYEDDDAVTIVGGWHDSGEPVTTGVRRSFGANSVSALVRETGRPGRVDEYPEGSEAELVPEFRSAVAAPITVEGRLWGLIGVASTSEDPPPPGTAARLGHFTELVAAAIANAEGREELRQVANDQTALRRVATLVARAAPAAEIFDAVTEEVHRLLHADQTGLSRYDPDGLWTVLANRGAMTDVMPIGFRLDPGPSMPGVAELLSGRPVRVDAPPVETIVDDIIRAEHVQAWVASPILLMGRTWGQVAVFSRHGPLPAGTEERLADFTDIVASAIANIEARDELRQVADEQAALRRVATLVAAGASPAEVFAAVAEEVGRLLSVDRAYVSQYDTGDMVTAVAGWSPTGENVPGLHQPLRGPLSIRVRETGRAQRSSARGDRALPELGNRSAVVAPITVEGRLWGLMGVAWTSEEQPPPGTEERLTKFTELVATAIANANARAELTASRARIVASADEARRKIERDLHDGAQQRLVTLALRLRATQAAVPSELDEVTAEIDQAVAGLDGVLEELRKLAHGIHPPILAEGGLGPALRVLARRSAVPVDLDLRTETRLAEPVEVAVYYVVSEALTNAAKHADATHVTVDVGVADDVLRVRVRDDGVGGAEFARGSGLVGLRDRVEALGGRIALESKRGAGTSVSVELPLSHERSTAAFG